MMVKRLDSVLPRVFDAGVSFSFMRVAVPSWRRAAVEEQSLPQTKVRGGLSREELVSLFDGDLAHARLRGDRERRKAVLVLTETERQVMNQAAPDLEATPN